MNNTTLHYEYMIPISTVFLWQVHILYEDCCSLDYCIGRLTEYVCETSMIFSCVAPFYQKPGHIPKGPKPAHLCSYFHQEWKCAFIALAYNGYPGTYDTPPKGRFVILILDTHRCTSVIISNRDITTHTWYPYYRVYNTLT